MEWLKRVDPDGTRYKPLGLYTEREPCGDGLGHARCSEVLGNERLQGVPIHYSATYREDPAGVQQRAALLDVKEEALKAASQMTPQEVKQELERRLHERLVPHSPVLPKALERLSKMSEEEAREQLKKAIVNENKRLRENLRTPTEEAITAEMGRHMEALSRTWEKLHTQLL